MKTAFSETEVHVGTPPEHSCPGARIHNRILADPSQHFSSQVRDTLMVERRSSGEDHRSSFGTSAEVQGPNLGPDMDPGSPEASTPRRDAEPEPPRLDPPANVR